MQFSLTGQTQNADVRTYAFDGNYSDRKTRGLTVSVDIALARRYAISLQELPLLCVRFLEEQTASSEATALTFSESAMRIIVGQREEAKRLAATRHKQPRRNRPAGARISPFQLPARTGS